MQLGAAFLRQAELELPNTPSLVEIQQIFRAAIMLEGDNQRSLSIHSPAQGSSADAPALPALLQQHPWWKDLKAGIAQAIDAVAKAKLVVKPAAVKTAAVCTASHWRLLRH